MIAMRCVAAAATAFGLALGCEERGAADGGMNAAFADENRGPFAADGASGAPAAEDGLAAPWDDAAAIVESQHAAGPWGDAAAWSGGDPAEWGAAEAPAAAEDGFGSHPEAVIAWTARDSGEDGAGRRLETGRPRGRPARAAAAAARRLGEEEWGVTHNMVVGAGTLTCEDTCEMYGMVCDEQEQVAINRNVQKCHDALEHSAADGNFVAGVKDHTYMVFPTGCYLTYRWSTFKVNVNTNSFGTDVWGCEAPPSYIGWAYRGCACAVTSGGPMPTR